MKKLAILFPGVGYTTDKPLLYYARKHLLKRNHKIIEAQYIDNPEREHMRYALQNLDPASEQFKGCVLRYVAKASEMLEKQLEREDFSQYDQIIFVGKSIGTVVGALFAKKKNINPLHILITPLEYVFSLLDENAKGVVFSGTSDPFASAEHVKQEAKKRDMNCHIFENANHSLETGDVDMDLKNLVFFAAELNGYLESIEKCVYDFTVQARDQKEAALSKYKGQVLLIVNTATGCGYTPQYRLLEEIQRAYNKQGFSVLDFPCNQFANQAPGSSDEIYSFCTSQYDISFPQFAKIHVNGETQSELYAYLKACRGFHGFDMDTPDGRFLARKLEEELPGYDQTSDIKWNFTKFLVDRNGEVIARYEPCDDFAKIKESIEKLL